MSTEVKLLRLAEPRPGTARRPGKGQRSGTARRRAKGRQASKARTQRVSTTGPTAAADDAEIQRPRGRAVKKTRRNVGKLPRWTLLVGAAAVVVGLASFAYFQFAPRQSHLVAVPASFDGYVKAPTLASATAQELKTKIVSGASGEVRNVVAAVYQKTTSPGTAADPEILVFIGGNLTGSGSAGSFISGFMTQLHGAFSTGAGRLGGQAACAPGTNGGPAECAWADGDTFGVIVSATLDARGLATELQRMRPLIEHPAK